MNHFKFKVSYKIWLIRHFGVVDDIKPLVIYYLVMVEKIRSFQSPLVSDIIPKLHIDIDGYPIYINKDGIVFQHLYKITVRSLRHKLTDLYCVKKHYNNIIYNYNVYRDDCYFIIHFIKSYIHDIVSFIPIKVKKYDNFHNEVRFYDYLITCN
jgi:hypothetical protein